MRFGKTAAAGLAIALAGGVLASTPWAGQTAVAHRSTAVDPTEFSHPRPNPYFPLKPGRVAHLRGTSEGEQFQEWVTITHKTKMILGVKTTVVRDVVRRANGRVSEKTTDWYAADSKGNVWYFGEKTATYKPNGQLESREGSWQAGVKGAVAGLIMPANPGPTKAYRQEFFRNHAEDQAWIVSRHTVLRTPVGKLHHVVRSFEWTRLEPGVISVKFYARGLGIVRERDMAGGSELFELVSVS